MNRLPIRAAVLLGTVVGVLSMAGPFLLVTLLPGPFQLLMPVLVIGIPLFVQWPRRFDQATDRWTSRLGRRLTLIAAAAVVAAVVGWIEFTAIPAYGAWSERVHRQNLERAGRSPAEIETALAQHRSTPQSFAFDNAVFTAVPGTIAALITLGAGAIVLRRRDPRGARITKPGTSEG